MSIKKNFTLIQTKKGLWVTENWLFKGKFWKSFKLKNFPVDVQELTLSFTSLKKTSEIKIKECETKLSAVMQEGFLDQQEWKLYSFVSCKEVLVSHELSEEEYPSFVASAFICRRPNYYHYNAFFLIFLITLSSLTTFSMRCDQPSARLQTTCTVLLTSITFKWIINRSLPNLYYLISLDFYSLLNILMICMECCSHALNGYLNGTSVNCQNTSDLTVKKCESIDKYLFLLFSLIFLLINCSFIYWYFFKAKRDSKWLDQKEKVFIKKFKNFNYYEQKDTDSSRKQQIDSALKLETSNYTQSSEINDRTDSLKNSNPTTNIKNHQKPIRSASLISIENINEHDVDGFLRIPSRLSDSNSLNLSTSPFQRKFILRPGKAFLIQPDCIKNSRSLSES